MKILKKRKNFKPFNQGGQTAVFFALLLPVLILFLFVVFDLGWLYLNKSRLQNAAEAAAIAGANRYCEVSQDGYNNVMLIYKITSESNQLSVTKSPDEINNAAKSSWSDNLGFSADSPTDSWTKSGVTPTYTIYKDNTNGKVYYEVKLSEEVGHIFKVLDIIPFTPVPVVAVAEITKIGERNLWSDMVKLDTTHTIGNWEEQNGARIKINSDKNKYKADDFTFYSYPERRTRYYYDGVWNHYQDPGTAADPTRSKVHYAAGSVYKYETITINPSNSVRDTARGTAANGNKVHDASLVDSLNLDFRQDVKLNFNGVLTADWDIGFDLAGTGINSVGISDSYYRDGWDKNEINLRVHATFNFDEPFITRTLNAAQKAKVDKRYANAFNETGITGPDADPLYVSIESEPMLSELYEKAGIMNQLNSVRQIILNFNETNMDADDDEKNHDYKYRPYVILYDGPEKVDLNSKRESQPVIVNLNADFRGILFMPNSPVVINGNGHKFQGFVIAKEFRKLKTEDNYTKFTMKVDDNDTDVFIENVNEDTEPAFSDEYVFVSKDDKSFFKVPRNDLIYLTAEYVEQQHLSDLKNADDYLLTEYYRKKGDEARTEAYIRKNLKIGESTDPDVDIIEGTLTDWYEVKRDSDNITFSIRNRNSNFLFYKDGWRIAKDNNGNPKYIFQIKSLISNLSDYVEVKDSNGQSAYIKKTSLNGLPSYIKITSENNESRFILKDSRKFYYKKVVDKSPTLFVDYHGNVQYTDKLTSTTNLSGEWHLDARGKSPVFAPATFGLDENKNDTHYSRCGAVPKRIRYSVLDSFEKDGGDYCQDMFFTTARSKYVI